MNIYDVDIDTIANLSGSQNYLVRIGIQANQTGKICGLHIGSVFSNAISNLPAIYLEDQTNAQLSIEHVSIDHLTIGDLVNGSGCSASPIYFGTATAIVELGIGHARIEADCASGSVNFALLEASTGTTHFNLGGAVARASGTTRNFALVRSTNTAAVIANLGNVQQIGGQQSLAVLAGSGTQEQGTADR